ncbi:hypothetical protein [Pasteuria penetrans]|uniref:hypothetical protein n=1 Tax=Pasteuria penetrans TaxID=86005 RepID=UPI0011ECD43D|nr:hypothetical protein [Pasteuria penetrans]
MLENEKPQYLRFYEDNGYETLRYVLKDGNYADVRFKHGELDLTSSWYYNSKSQNWEQLSEKMKARKGGVDPKELGGEPETKQRPYESTGGKIADFFDREEKVIADELLKNKDPLYINSYPIYKVDGGKILFYSLLGGKAYAYIHFKNGKLNQKDSYYSYYKGADELLKNKDPLYIRSFPQPEGEGRRTVYKFKNGKLDMDAYSGRIPDKEVEAERVIADEFLKNKDPRYILSFSGVDGGKILYYRLLGGKLYANIHFKNGKLDSENSQYFSTDTNPSKNDKFPASKLSAIIEMIKEIPEVVKNIAKDYVFPYLSRYIAKLWDEWIGG